MAINDMFLSEAGNLVIKELERSGKQEYIPITQGTLSALISRSYGAYTSVEKEFVVAAAESYIEELDKAQEQYGIAVAKLSPKAASVLLSGIWTHTQVGRGSYGQTEERKTYVRAISNQIEEKIDLRTRQFTQALGQEKSHTDLQADRKAKDTGRGTEITGR